MAQTEIIMSDLRERRADDSTAALDQDQDAIMEASRLADSQVPDGGYGWVVVFAGAVIAWWFVGSSYSWGVMQAALVKNGYSPSTLAFVGSLCPACIAILAVPNATLMRLLGARMTGLLGIFLLGLGVLLSSFAEHSIPGLFMTWGVIDGIGTSFCFMVSCYCYQNFKAFD
jgi:hypothetical protein